MGLSRNKVAVSEGAAGSPPFYGERTMWRDPTLCSSKRTRNDIDEEVLKERIMLFNFQGAISFLKKQIVSVSNAEGPPVPIPNTEVKLCSGDNTSREAVREDSSMLTLALGVMKYSLLRLEKRRKAKSQE